MDSGNTSGSNMQSSSSADEESYDSRADQSSNISAFFNNQQQPPSHVGPFTATKLPNSHPQNHHNNTHMLLDPYLDIPIQKLTPPLPHPNSMWSKPPRSQPNQNHLGSLMPCSSSPSQTGGNNNDQASHNHTLLPSENNGQTNNNNNNSNLVRNPKKRSRASRRAPTTVLTTDTTNFRAMVQEFTGIPAPPFTSSPNFPRTRLDLFASTSTVRSTHLDPPYLLRPLAQKLPHHNHNHNHHPFPPSTSSSLPPMMDTLLASFNNPTNNSTTTNSTSINYQLPNLFQTMLQAPPNKYPLANPSLEIPTSAADSHLKMGVFEFEELMGRGHHVNADLNSLHENTVSVGVGAMSSGNNNASTEWAQRTGTITNNDCDDNGERALSGTVNYNNNIHGEKGSQVVGYRSNWWRDLGNSEPPQSCFMEIKDIFMCFPLSKMIRVRNETHSTWILGIFMLANM